MTKFEYKGTAYPTRDLMLRDMVSMFLTKNGDRTPEEVLVFINDRDAVEIAEDMTHSWDLGEDTEDGVKTSHMDRYGYFVDELSAAVKAFLLHYMGIAPAQSGGPALDHKMTCKFCGRDYRGDEADEDIFAGAPCPADDCPSHSARPTPDMIRAMLDRQAQRLMAQRADLAPASLDEWLARHHDNLSADHRRIARAIIDAYDAEPVLTACTVLVMEWHGPCPPVYPYPLQYDMDLPEAFDEILIRDMVARIRYEEIEGEIDDGDALCREDIAAMTAGILPMLVYPRVAHIADYRE